MTSVHRAAFPHSALTRLGAGAVHRYYHWQLTGPHECAAIGAFEGDEIAGFLVGGSFRGATRGFVRHHAAYLMLQAAMRPWLWANRTMVSRMSLGTRLLTRSPKQVAPVSPSMPVSRKRSFGVLAIATHPDFQRRGVGRQLMGAAESVARTRGYTHMHLTVHSANLQAIEFYRFLGWRRDSSGPHSDQMSKSLLSP